MLLEKRRYEIVKYVGEKDSFSVHELRKKFNVTLMTINRTFISSRIFSSAYVSVRR